MDLIKKINAAQPVILDGAMGSVLIEKGYTQKDVLSNRQILTDIHKSYVDTGCDIILTNTFSLSPCMTVQQLESNTDYAIQAAKDAVRGTCAYVAFDAGPTGILYKPYGKEDVKQAYSYYRKLFSLSCMQKADIIFFETMADVNELKMASLAAFDTLDKPVMASMTFTEKKRTWLGTHLDEFANLCNELPFTAVGLNCTLTPKPMLDVLMDLKKLTDKPLIAEPNRGNPIPRANSTPYYEMSSEEFAQGVEEIYNAGVHIIGGCCGSDQECMKKICQRIKNR